MAKRRPAGDGMVRKREDGRWEGRIVIGHRENGEPLFRHVYAKTQKALLDKLHQNIECYRDVELTEDSRMTLGEWLDRWLTEYKEGTVRPGTLKSYRCYIEYYIKPQLGDKQISLISQQDIQRMYRRLKTAGRIHEHPEMDHQLSDSMVRHIHSTLHAALKDAVQAHVIPRNPTEGTTAPKPNYKPKRILTGEELDAFLAVVERDEMWRDFFQTELMTGLRRGEICGLQWSDFDEEGGTLKVCRTLHSQRKGEYTVGETKTGKGMRTILLPKTVADILRRRRADTISQWIFPDPVKPEDPVNPGSAYLHMKTLLRRAGLPSIRFHDLRHPYVKHTTKIFSLRLKVFQAQPVPDALRKTRGAFLHLREGGNHNPFLRTCNKKLSSWSIPQSKMSLILYAISMRLSGYTSTLSMRRSVSSAVRPSELKTALAASCRLSCRACSSCFCFACANTTA